MRHFISKFVVFAGLLTLSFSSASAQCPASGWDSGPYSDSSTNPIYSAGGASWNLIEGTFAGGSSGGGEAGWFLSLGVRDNYRLVGPSSATPIPFKVRVVLTGYASGSIETLPHAGTFCTGSSFTFNLVHGAAIATRSVSSTQTPCAGAEINEVVELELSKLPDEEFLLLFGSALSNGTFQSVSVNGVITFLVPSGYSVASCQGYAGQAVPVSPTSWGRLKQTYR